MHPLQRAFIVAERAVGPHPDAVVQDLRAQGDEAPLEFALVSASEPASARAVLLPNGTAIVSSAASDMGLR